MSQNRDHSALLDMLRAGDLLQQFLMGKSLEQFERDLMCYSAVIRQLEILGEAANWVSKAFQELYPEIPWRKIVGIRNILIHAYDNVDTEEVWQVATVSIPLLMVQIKALLQTFSE